MQASIRLTTKREAGDALNLLEKTFVVIWSMVLWVFWGSECLTLIYLASFVYASIGVFIG